MDAAATGPVPADWVVYTNPQYRYRLRYPPSWRLRADDPASIVLVASDEQAHLTIRHVPQDCGSLQATLRAQPAFNTYAVGQTETQVAQRDVTLHELFDTVAGMRELAALVPVDAACIEARRAYREGAGAEERRATLALMVSTFEFLPSPPSPAG